MCILIFLINLFIYFLLIYILEHLVAFQFMISSSIYLLINLFV